MAATVVKTGRQLFVKLKATHHQLLERALTVLKAFDPPPFKVFMIEKTITTG